MKHFARMISNHVRIESFAMRAFLAANLGRNIGIVIRELVGRFMRQSVKIYEKATEAVRLILANEERVCELVHERIRM